MGEEEEEEGEEMEQQRRLLAIGPHSRIFPFHI